MFQRKVQTRRPQDENWGNFKHRPTSHSYERRSYRHLCATRAHKLRVKGYTRHACRKPRVRLAKVGTLKAKIAKECSEMRIGCETCKVAGQPSPSNCALGDGFGHARVKWPRYRSFDLAISGKLGKLPCFGFCFHNKSSTRSSTRQYVRAVTEFRP